MTNYYSPTVVQQTIPNEDITQLERLLFAQIFECELDNDGLYFFAEEGLSELISVSHKELATAVIASQGVESEAYSYIIAQLPDIATAHLADDDPEIELDLSTASWERFFQSVIRRSSKLDYITIFTAFTCSKMRPDGFGGMVILITADTVLSKGTDDILCELMDQAEHGAAEPARSLGNEVRRP